MVLGRIVTTATVLTTRKRRWVEHSAIIIGSGPIAAELARLIKRHPQHGLRFNGFVDDLEPGTSRDGVIGSIDDIEKIMHALECEVMIIADSSVPELKLMEVIRQHELMNCDIWMVPRLYDFQSHGGQADHIGAMPVTRVGRASLTGMKWGLKRAFDIVFASIALVLLSPLMLLCALAVRIEGGPGVTFRQQRVGHFGKQFNVLKFRSMDIRQRARVGDQLVGGE